MFRKILNNVSISAFNLSNVWFVSDYGSDDSDCHSESTPCKNLQMVLDNATDGADIYVTSDTLSLDHVRGVVTFPYTEEVLDCCQLSSNISYSLSSLNENLVNITCTGQYYKAEGNIFPWLVQLFFICRSRISQRRVPITKVLDPTYYLAKNSPKTKNEKILYPGWAGKSLVNGMVRKYELCE